MSSVLNYPHLGIFIIAWFAADLLFPLLIKAARRLRLLDRPGGHKGQAHSIPFLGGVGIFIAFTLSVVSTLRFEEVQAFAPLMGLLLGGAVMVLLGLLDDFRPINAVIKLFTILGTTVVLACFGITLSLFPDVMFNIPNILLTALWIAGVTSAMNSLDNTDGVAGGTSAIAGLFIFLIAWGTNSADAQPWLSYLGIALFGGCLGFLRYNSAPAKIYLGDNGAFFLGYVLSTMLVFGHYSADPIKAILVPCLVLSVPLFDIVLATALRFRDGDVRTLREAVVYCGRDHTAHLLIALRFSKRQAALAIYALAICGGLTGLLVLNTPTTAIYLSITGIYLSFLVGVGMVLGRVRQRALATKSESEMAAEQAAQQAADAEVSTKSGSPLRRPIRHRLPRRESLEV
ncbi:MAG: MraY family glycosyltransferase [Planctomycetota bacterium]